MNKLRKFAFALLGCALAVAFTSCGEPTNPVNPNDGESVFSVEYGTKVLKDGDVLEVTEMDVVGTMHFKGKMYNDDKKERTLTITETRKFDLAKYTMEGCIGISCVPSNGEEVEVWKTITGATSPGGAENFEFKLSVPEEYQSVPATATSVFVFSNGDEEISVTVNFVIAGE